MSNHDVNQQFLGNNIDIPLAQPYRILGLPLGTLRRGASHADIFPSRFLPMNEMNRQRLWEVVVTVKITSMTITSLRSNPFS